MKTNLKTAILGIALMASVTGAFAADIASVFSANKKAVYHWVKIDRTTGQPITGSETDGTEANPYPEDCNGSNELCAEGTLDGQSTPSLFYNYN
ncbi:hypothetical protein [Pedobacter miscanthi]|uniref:hypothetical protein n=1 Tax=Pedobacter miscanthi TaxID=2259170 RepID=UPI00293172A2|nr:hypothetical protein [Pedobacter miscanthi]